MKNHTRKSKYDPPVTPATLLHANPSCAQVRLPSGVETTVSIRDVARHPDDTPIIDNLQSTSTQEFTSETSGPIEEHPYPENTPQSQPQHPSIIPEHEQQNDVRRSSRIRRPPPRFPYA